MGTTSRGDNVALFWSDWPSEQRAFPESQREAARQNAGGVIAEIDQSMLPHSDAWAPLETYHGVFQIDETGTPTGRYFRNPAYGPVKDDFSPFEGRKPQLWFPDDEAGAMKDALAGNLADQLPGSTVEWVKFRGKVETRVGGPRDGDHLTVRRCGMAVEFVCSVLSPRGREFLHGVITVATTGLDKPGTARSRVWMDVAGELPVAEALAKLDERVFEIDRAGDQASTPKRKWWRR
jgi:hypothetical protein